MPGTCFHCSYCFDSVKLVQYKIASFSHRELNIPRFQDRNHIIDCFRNGKDLFDRVNEPLRRVNIREIDLPKLLKMEGARFSYMLNRSFPNAGFLDV